MSQDAETILILTGAGISAESGLSTFRDKGGLWRRYETADVATPEGFARDPDLVHEFYNLRRRKLATVSPNAAHKALARLQRDYPGRVVIVTQNVDDLHERAGGRDIIHMHGEILKMRCTACGESRRRVDDLGPALPCPDCGQQGTLRPDVVWFGETPCHLPRIQTALGACGLFLSIGTSGNVYPAAGFVAAAHARGVPTVELNLEPSEQNGHFGEARYGPATSVVPAWVDRFLEQFGKDRR